MEKEFLPIGTVVTLKNANVLAMIAGYLSVPEGESEKVWDYSGFIFPIGYMSDDKILSFDNDQIEEVIAYGYRDIETDAFLKEIEEARKEIDEKKEEA